MELDLTQYLDYILMSFLAVIGLAIIRLKNLFAIVMLTGVYSLLSAAWFVSLDAVDVAFTEAAVGAGISTILLLGAMLLTARECDPVSRSRHRIALGVVLVTGLTLFYALPDMPDYGDPNSPANAYVGAEYIQRTPQDIAIPNVVTAILASYRGFDTLGEVVVVFTAGVGVMLLLGFGAPRAGRGRFQTRPGERPQPLNGEGAQ